MNWNKALISLVGALLVSGAAVPKAVEAETWIWTVETHGADVSWTSPTAVPTTWWDYDWSAQCTKADVQLGGALWLNMLSDLGDTYRSGIDHALPFDIYKDHIRVPGPGLEDSYLVFDLHHWLDALGQGQTTVSNVVFGSLLGNPLTGFRATVETTVTPEPATLLLLALGGLTLLRRRARPSPRRLRRENSASG